MNILVTGAAGYIGSVVTEQLVEQGHHVIALDSLKHGHRKAIHRDAQFVQADLRDGTRLKSLIASNPIDAVVHLAAEALIDESIRDPGLFFGVNVCGGLNLLEAMALAGVTRIIFSSTASVYGEPQNIPITEDDPVAPVNTYGESKLAFERMLGWYRRAYGLNYISLRYFNACGATKLFGEYHVPETHIIPLLFEVALGHRATFRLFGTDYETPDHTCIRDYVHVSDIAQAHVLALSEIDRLGTRCYNIGNRIGYSNQQVIEIARQVTRREIPIIPDDRRPGDPARLVASSERIRQQLGWQPLYPDLMTMVESAWAWRQEHPRGYDE